LEGWGVLGVGGEGWWSLWVCFVVCDYVLCRAESG